MQKDYNEQGYENYLEFNDSNGFSSNPDSRQNYYFALISRISPNSNDFLQMETFGDLSK
jgi:hypothetical protein